MQQFISFVFLVDAKNEENKLVAPEILAKNKNRKRAFITTLFLSNTNRK